LKGDYGNNPACGAEENKANSNPISKSGTIRAGIKTLTLFIHGTPGNTGQLYVKVNGLKVGS